MNIFRKIFSVLSIAFGFMLMMPVQTAYANSMDDECTRISQHMINGTRELQTLYIDLTWAEREDYLTRADNQLTRFIANECSLADYYTMLAQRYANYGLDHVNSIAGLDVNGRHDVAKLCAAQTKEVSNSAAMLQRVSTGTAEHAFYTAYNQLQSRYLNLMACPATAP